MCVRLFAREFSRTDAISKAATAHNEETAKLRAAKESLEAAQVAAQKKQEAELERLRTQLVFKQHEAEISRKAASRAPAPSQAPGPSQIPRWDTPSTPRRQSRPPAAQSPSPHRHQKRPAQGSSRAPVQLPGFVNAFAPPKKAKVTARPHASQFELSQGIRERDLDPPPAPRTQIDEQMEVVTHYGNGQLGITEYPDVDLRVDMSDDVRVPQPQHVAGSSSRTTKPFDWLGWVGSFFFSLLFVRRGSSPLKMRQLVLAHSMSPTAPSTIQLLLTQSQFDANHATTFPLACTSLMDAVAASAGSYDPIARVVVDSLAQIVYTLLISVRVSSPLISATIAQASPQLKPLVSTLNLLGVLVISLPSFAMNLLKPTNGPAFLEIICTMIVNLLQPSNTNSSARENVDERELYPTIAREVFGLLDAIIYSLPPEYHYQ